VPKKRMSKSSLLWFIRSRSYVTVADLRRRFGVVDSDDVSSVAGPAGKVYVGLPTQQADLLRDLWCEGKIGFELAMDIKAPTVTGVYGIYQRGERVERDERPYPSPPDSDDAAESGRRRSADVSDADRSGSVDRAGSGRSRDLTERHGSDRAIGV
jgi:hypothetical protein